MKHNNNTDIQTAGQSVWSGNRLIFVLVLVLIFCGGNGAGMLAGALIWKMTGQLKPAILAVVGITVLAFVIAMLAAVGYLRSVAASSKSAEPDEHQAE